MFAASAATKAAKVALAAKDDSHLVAPKNTLHQRRMTCGAKNRTSFRPGVVTRARNQTSVSRRVIPVLDSSTLNNHNQYPTTTNAARRLMMTRKRFTLRLPPTHRG